MQSIARRHGLSIAAVVILALVGLGFAQATARAHCGRCGVGDKAEAVTTEAGEHAMHAAMADGKGCPGCKMMAEGKATMAKVDGLLAEAEAAIEAGDAELAAAKIGEARAAIKAQQELMDAHMAMMAEKAGVVNRVCPIMGGKIEAANVPDDLTRVFKGRKVGFCCAACPRKWDKLSDEEKAAKLKAAMPEEE